MSSAFSVKYQLENKSGCMSLCQILPQHRLNDEVKSFVVVVVVVVVVGTVRCKSVLGDPSLTYLSHNYTSGYMTYYGCTL